MLQSYHMRERLLEMKCVLFLLFAIIPSFTLGQDDLFQYGRGKDSGKLWISETATGDIIIPSSYTIDGVEYDVIEVLGPYKNTVRRLVLPNTVKTIYLGQCDQLEEVILPNSLETIKGSCFSGHIKLKSIQIPSSVTTIGNCAFSGSGITDIAIPNSVKNIGSLIFFKCEELTKVIIPESITSIGELAFSNCIKLSSVDFPGKLTTIEKGAFSGCKSLREIHLPGSITSIGESAFAYCENITKIKLPNSVIHLGESAFKGCKNLQSISLSNKLTSFERWTITDTQIKELTLPNSIKRLGDQSLCCDSLLYLIVPDIEPQTETTYHPLRYLHNVKGIAGHNEILPKWVIPHIYEYSPFAKHGMILPFSFYAKNKISRIVEKWQEKGEFETIAQWKSRVTEDKRQAIVSKEIPKIRDEYLSKYKPSPSTYSLGTYDAEQNVFPLIIDGKDDGSLFIKVPLADAQRFKQTFSSNAIMPSYGIVNDEVVATSFNCVIGGKNYSITNNYAKDNSKDITLDLPPLDLDFGEKKASSFTKMEVHDNSIDVNIPKTSMLNANTFAVIIGNENYSKVSKVQFAQNDARSFAEYCKKTLGIPEKNVRGYEDATYGTMVSAIKDIQKIAEAYKGEINVIFYYAGHGIPDNASRDAYLLPVDADGRQMDICYSLDKLYQELGGMNAKRVTVFLDACFSGSVRGEGMITAARGVAIKAKPCSPQGNMVVFSAATDGQTAFPYSEKGHGMFTYFLLKKLRETKGEVTLGELGDYIKDEVAKQAIVVNGREQTPTINCSQVLLSNWNNLKLK